LITLVTVTMVTADRSYETLLCQQDISTPKFSNYSQNNISIENDILQGLFS